MIMQTKPRYREAARRVKEGGFSLVELGISLVVIGLLLGGVLKGAEMMENARGAKMIAQIKQYDGAINAFKKIYGFLPGDIRDPAKRIPHCSATECSTNGNGNGLIDGSPGNMWFVNYFTNDGENRRVWLQMAKTGLISGIDLNYPEIFGGNPVLPGVDYPATPWSESAYDVFFWESSQGPFAHPDAHYIKTKSHPLNSGGATKIPALSLAIVDRKIDDGKPSTGRMVAFRGFNQNCQDGAANVYLSTKQWFCEGVFQMDF